MRLSFKKWRWIGLVLVVLVGVFLVVRTWVVPAVIVAQIQKQYRGRVVVRDWWFNFQSAGLKGVVLGESPASDSAEWFSAESITADVSLGSVIRGRVKPRTITIDKAQVTFLLDAKGQPTTRIPLAPTDPRAPKAARSPLPEIVAHDGSITLQQEGRKPMKLTHVEARLFDGDGRENIEIKTDDPTWGQVAIKGHFDSSFKNGELEIDSSPDFVADPEKLERIPFIPAEVWTNIEPRGPVVAKVKITLAADAPRPVHVLTDLTLRGTTAKLNTLQVESTDTTGHVVIDNAVVKVQSLTGRAIDGSIAASGTLDFGQKIPQFDLNLNLKGVDVTKTPAAWQLGEIGATGTLSGQANLKVALPPSGPDLTGTTGQAVIENGSLQGIPIKALSVSLKAEGTDLQYASLPQGSVVKDAFLEGLATAPAAPKGNVTARPDPVEVEIWEPVIAALPVVRMATQDRGVLGWAAHLASEAVAYQAKQTPAKAGGGGFRLPRTISTRIELEDVDLVTILAKAEKFGIKIPVPVAGRLSLKAAATIPLGALKDIKEYVFKGDATLSGASIDHVDLGLVTAHLELSNGILDLSDFRGQFVDHPLGSEKNPPKPTAVPPKTGPLPPGAFRANLRASISPKGPASAKIEGQQLPIGELFAPVLPVPTPVSGELTLQAEARADVANLADPKAWSFEGRADSRRITYQGAVLDQVATTVHIKNGRLEVPAFAARLAGRPLQAKGGLDLAAPYRYDAKINIEGWQIAEVLGFVPGMPRPSPVSGVIDANGEAEGALQPFEVRTQGGARIAHAKVGSSPLGHAVFRWMTDHDVIAITGLELFVFGGKVTGEARVPTRVGPLLEVSATLKGIDAARLSSTFLGQNKLTVTGKADGRIKLALPLDASIIDADAHLTAPDLTIREGAGAGIPIKAIRVSAVAQKGVLAYDATAESLGGRMRFHGSSPAGGDLSKALANAEFQFAGFRLGETWRGLGMTKGLAELDGLGAFDANLRATVHPFKLWTRGAFELRDLHYGHYLSLGNLQGVASLSPTSWRIEEVNGDLLGGLAQGEAHSETRPGGSRHIAFDFKVERAALARMMTAVPALARGVEGFGSVRVAGRVAESLQASAEVSIPRARVLGLPISDLRFPAEIEIDPASGIGSIHARHWTGRLAGGSIRGNGWMRLGEDRTFQTDLHLMGVDLEVINRSQSVGKKSVSGKVSGKITLNGPNPENLAKMRGKVELDLDDASLVELPLFKELDRFLGSAKGGGLFEDGDIHATIFNRTIFVDQMTLFGRLIQVHASGTVTFEGGLNLEVLVNTNDIIPQTGLALVGIIPGLGQALGRGEEALLRVAAFLENHLLKFRVSGTVGDPVVQLDAGVGVGGAAAGFFSSALKVPGGGGRRSD